MKIFWLSLKIRISIIFYTFSDFDNLFNKKIATITNPEIPITPVGLGPINLLTPGIVTSAGHSPITLIEPCKILEIGRASCRERV